MADPISIGGVVGRNVNSLTFNPSVAVPAGALLFISVGTNAGDSANITIADSIVLPATPNAYSILVNSAQQGTNAALFLFISPIVTSLSTSQTITLNSNIRADYGISGYLFTGLTGAVLSCDVEWFATTTPVYNIPLAQAGMQLFGVVALAGPSSDVFTQDPNWGPDVTSGLQSTTITIHGCGRMAPTAGSYSWAPILGTARQSVGFACAFR